MSKLAYFLSQKMSHVKFSVTVWANNLTGFQRSYLALLENAMDYWVLSYH